MPSAESLLTVSGLCKSYAAPVLCDVDFDLRRGEVHALVGENGAGKTTLARIIAGVTRPEAGQMRLGGRPFAPATKQEAERRGVRIVMQELHVVGNLTVAENIYLAQLPRRWGLIDYAQLHADACEVMARVGLEGIAPDRPVHTLGIGQQQLVEIAAGLSRCCDLLILDEPTAALTDAEVERLFAQIERLKAAGTGILLKVCWALPGPVRYPGREPPNPATSHTLLDRHHLLQRTSHGGPYFSGSCCHSYQPGASPTLTYSMPAAR